MDIGVYGVYPMVALFRSAAVRALGCGAAAYGVDGQGTLVCRYDGMDAVVVHSKIADSSLPSEIQGENGRIVIDRINAIDSAWIIFRDGTQEDISAPHERYDMVLRVVSVHRYGRARRGVAWCKFA